VLSDEPTAGEFALIERLRRRLPAIGDDAAILGGGLLASVDTLVSGIDWRDDWSSPADVGWKSIMVNASDIAAMGGRPTHFLVAMVVADDFDVDGFYDGALEACAALRADVVGGDLSSGPTTVVSVTALGHAERPIRRSGATVGERVWVSGPLGAASRDLRNGGGAAHRRPTAYLGSLPGSPTAMIDVSDGLVADCAHIAAASGVCIALDDVPLADGATLDDALHGGDDYVLVACSHVAMDGWTPIGVCRDGHGVTYDGAPVEPRGWEHKL
jgi:thiamine-monophosphate kinase